MYETLKPQIRCCKSMAFLDILLRSLAELVSLLSFLHRGSETLVLSSVGQLHALLQTKQS